MDQLLPEVSRLWVMFHDSAAALCLGDFAAEFSLTLRLSAGADAFPVLVASRRSASGVSPLSPWLYYVQFDCVAIT